MAFESCTELARRGLKQAGPRPWSISMKTDAPANRRPQTIFRFSDDLVARAGWMDGSKYDVLIDRADMTLKICPVSTGRYTLHRGRASRPHLKFTVARGMPLCDEPVELTDVVVEGREVVCVLPAGVRFQPA